MADISKITIPGGGTYDIKDAAARADIETLKGSSSGGIHYLGVSETAIADGSTTNPITIGGKSVTASNGDIAIYGTSEFIFSYVDHTWHEFGSTGSLKALAFKDSASGSYTPEGTVSAPTFNPAAVDVSVSGTPTGSIKTGSGATNYTPEGSLTGGAISVSLNSATKYVASSATGGGSVTDGSAAQCTLPTFTATVASETLTIGWTAGSFTANTPTVVTLPSFSSATVASSVKSATITALPQFSGTPVDLEFEGNSMTSTGSVTAAGTIGAPTFTGTAKTVSVS